MCSVGLGLVEILVRIPGFFLDLGGIYSAISLFKVERCAEYNGSQHFEQICLVGARVQTLELLCSVSGYTVSLNSFSSHLSSPYYPQCGSFGS